MFEVKRYTPVDKPVWDAFVAKARNATFLFFRDYMDYHADRFSDYSLLVFRKGRLYALLPGNAQGDTYYSHQGLTYGGLLFDAQATADGVCEAFLCINGFLRSSGFRRVVYKPIPHIYHQQPAEEDLYALFVRCGAQLTERDVSSAMVLDRRIPFTESRRSGLRKALRCGITIGESRRLDLFWPLLTENLRQRYAAVPVHTLAEMQLLMSRFPENIRLFLALDVQGQPLGGTVLYLSPQVVHTQYISASAEGKQAGALDKLFSELLSADWGRRYFDFGTSACPDSCEVVPSLLFQKLGFGGRAVCYDRYVYPL